MPDIKKINDAAKIENLRPEQSPEAAQNGNFQGASASAVPPPVESPIAESKLDAAQQLNAKRAEPPVESPVSSSPNQVSKQVSNPGYRITDRPSQTGKVHPPSSEQLFDYATGDTKNQPVRAYLDQDPAASRAVAAIRQGHAEIGSSDAEPQLDQAAETRLNEIAKDIFRR